MTDPFDELAAELGVETIKPPRPEEPPPQRGAVQSQDQPADCSPGEELRPLAQPPVELQDEPAPTDLTERLFKDDAVTDNFEHEPTEVGPEQEIIELGGTEEQKKRRRRRRRRKKGEPGEPVDEPAAESEIAAQPSELLREIISKWDVPSWDEIVAGLYRPNR